MLQSIINQIVPVAITAIVGILIAIIKAVGDAAVDYINKKKEAVVTQTGIDQYNSKLILAKNIWNLVDEAFRITPTLTATIEAKQKMFEEEMLKVIPELTSDEIAQLRQVIAGEINKGKEVVVAPASDTTTITN
jgi:hypothetical protein